MKTSFKFHAGVLILTLSTIIAGLGCATQSPQSPRAHVLRLKPGQDVRQELEAYAKQHSLRAASIVSAVGSLRQYHLRFANQTSGTMKSGYFEVVSLSGTLAASGLHLHMAVSDAQGKTLGGHLLEANLVYTTLELAILEYPNVEFLRVHDPSTGFKELKIEAK